MSSVYLKSRITKQHIFLLSSSSSNEIDGRGDEIDISHHSGMILSGGKNDDCQSEQSSLMSLNTRRQFFQQQILATTIFPTFATAATATSDLSNGNGFFSLRNNNNVPYAQRMQQEKAAEMRKRATSIIKKQKWAPFKNTNKWNSIETCLLEMLPVKNIVYRQLQTLIENLEIYSPSDSDGWGETLLDAIAILSYLNTKRSSLEPVFNQEDPTELYIAKSSLGEQNIEALRIQLEELIDIASGDIDIDIDTSSSDTVNSARRRKKKKKKKANMPKEYVNIDDPAAGDMYADSFKTDTKGGNRGRQIDTSKNNKIAYVDINMDKAGEIDAEAFTKAKRKAFLLLSELGELLVPSFPYAVPTSGKWADLPRLLGRCTVTLSFERPSTATKAFGVNLDFDSDKRFLGNVTIVADGYAAPITAGNFVDLSERNFYTGLSVKAMRKRLGVIPTLTQNTIVNDLAEIKDNLDELGASAFEFPEALNKNSKDKGLGGIFRPNEDDRYVEPVYDESRLTMDAVLPILGSFQEGFYDPLTAKPRRIPLEIVALDSDSTSPTKSTLTYSSSYATLDDDMMKSGTTTYSVIASSSSAQRSFSSATSESSTNTTATTSSNLNPVLSFNIPDLVALNHPDRISNFGSSEFFALPRRDVSMKRAKLLDGQYSPFGYIIEGSDVYQSLRPGDIIKSTDVSDTGLLNLVKIRSNAFAKEEEVIVDDESIEDGTSSGETVADAD